MGNSWIGRFSPLDPKSKCQHNVDIKALVLELRYKMKDVLRALDRKEQVTILYRGKVKGTITPVDSTTETSARKESFFGSLSEEQTSIAGEIEKLRGGRFRAL